MPDNAVPDKKTLTFALMDPPYESACTTTALRLIDIAVRRGYAVNVFAYEGAVLLPFARQQPHANAVHGRTVEEENHLLTKNVIAALAAEATQNGGKLDWVNCGLCVDERGAGEAIEGIRRGSPADFWKMAEASDNTLVIATR
jgi:sulfur relay (sulfurtransferase) complex TusBCD TusD component (DsrE family)